MITWTEKRGAMSSLAAGRATTAFPSSSKFLKASLIK